MVRCRTASVKRVCLSAKLQKAYDKIRDEFTISTEKLKDLTDRFEFEMEKGLLMNRGTIPMIPTWVTDYVTGDEKGDFLAIDLGGTNLRVVSVHLKGSSDFDFEHVKYVLPDSVRKCSCEELWDFIGDSLAEFMQNRYKVTVVQKIIPLGFTFSFPATQGRVNEGVLQRWTKGFDIAGVEGHDVVPLLQNAIDKRALPVKVTALINDTTGTLVASLYSDLETKMGLIFGTGVNGAYYEKASSIQKLLGSLPKEIARDGSIPMAINTEYGAFDNDHTCLPRTKYDIQLDEESPRPNQQSYEKMVAGYYMGEVLRLILLDLHQQGLIFRGQDVSKLSSPFIMDTSYPARAEEDDFCDLCQIYNMMKNTVGIQTTLVERELIQELSRLIGRRAARLSACAIAAICKRINCTTGHCACDGSVFHKYPFFKERAQEALDEILSWNTSRLPPIELVAAEDGSGVGAAIVACLAQNKKLKKHLYQSIL
ncbi:DEKNAAC105588 [Brettanomyces naardenensis]|uniref:Phosphotransferase n=1 Tax=Brettanomyces naardenensis TaxID=13370 RepID=A0A448YU16_BRENA|nr:DEKNAAC105588 [Brettanomyces naardenensis]